MTLCSVILLFTTFTAGLGIYISKQKLFYFSIAHSSQLSYVESSSKRHKQALVSRTVLSHCAAKTQTTMDSTSRSKRKIEIAPVTVLKRKKDETETELTVDACLFCQTGKPSDLSCSTFYRAIKSLSFHPVYWTVIKA